MASPDEGAQLEFAAETAVTPARRPAMLEKRMLIDIFKFSLANRCCSVRECEVVKKKLICVARGYYTAF